MGLHSGDIHVAILGVRGLRFAKVILLSTTQPPGVARIDRLFSSSQAGSAVSTRQLWGGSMRALPTETHVESGTSQSKSGTSVNLSSSGKRTVVILKPMTGPPSKTAKSLPPVVRQVYYHVDKLVARYTPVIFGTEPSPD